LKDQDDLPFQRGEILTVIRKDEDQWWTARNSSGKIGQIPVPYICQVRKIKFYSPVTVVQIFYPCRDYNDFSQKVAMQ